MGILSNLAYIVFMFGVGRAKCKPDEVSACGYHLTQMMNAIIAVYIYNYILYTLYVYNYILYTLYIYAMNIVSGQHQQQEVASVK